ncbi:hypothetical protein CTAYLR_008830 [Chrysophaeum taylorii]|uniref:Carbohydrate kinase PfkB domain-containing protein n=1 Tax=Chrysophaeum taylorii TaxID=2483200 RepID=A0AAD7UCG2_9STRA|nr:hypothetical protein CTAYLR_008830 [Chrysophaeum taylorii]
MRWLRVSEEVRWSLPRVVALESTIITHGMPYPRNLETARRVEAAVRAKGVVPATIAILDGQAHVGLSDAQLERVASAETPRKCSTRDVAAACVQGVIGGTTVGATAAIAEKAGIGAMATGGIGGVHWGDRMDVSNDLVELGRHRVAVVCAGCKSVLDVEKTLEVLETHGVAVFGYGSDLFQTFFTASKWRAPLRVDAPEEVARWLRVGLGGGAVVAVPHASYDPIVDRAVSKAVDESPGDTPRMLARIEELTGGRSLELNIELVVRNAGVAADVAKAIVSSSSSDMLVVGASSIDQIDGRMGGVARNIAQAAGACGLDVALVSAASLFEPSPAYDATRVLASPSMPWMVDGVFVEPAGYGAYLAEAVANSSNVARLVVADADLPEAALDIVLNSYQTRELWFDPTTPGKARRYHGKVASRATLVAPNEPELVELTRHLPSAATSEDRAVALASSAKTRVLATLGDRGVLFVDRERRVHRFPAAPIVSNPTSTVGAGDTLLGVTAAAWLDLFDASEPRLPDAIRIGVEAAALTVQHDANVSPAISPAWLRTRGPSST